jgi:hypothetical protein
VALHIGEDVRFELSDDDRRALAARVVQLRAACDVDGVALFFDDVDLALLDDATRRNTDEAGVWRLAASAQADAAQCVRDAWHSQLVAAAAVPPLFLLCPSAYHDGDRRTGVDAYLAQLGQSLHSSFDVLWTGDNIISRCLTKSRLLRYQCRFEFLFIHSQKTV